MSFVVPKRCPRCHKKLGTDGKCKNPDCILYRPDTDEETTNKAKEMAESEGND